MRKNKQHICRRRASESGPSPVRLRSGSGPALVRLRSGSAGGSESRGGWAGTSGRASSGPRAGSWGPGLGQTDGAERRGTGC